MSIAILADAKTLVEDAARRLEALVGIHTQVTAQADAAAAAIGELKTQVQALAERVGAAIASFEAEAAKVPTVEEAVAQIKALLAKVPG